MYFRESHETSTEEVFRGRRQVNVSNDLIKEKTTLDIRVEVKLCGVAFLAIARHHLYRLSKIPLVPVSLR